MLNLVPDPCCQQSINAYGQPAVLVAALTDSPASTTTQFVEERYLMHELLANTCPCYRDSVTLHHIMRGNIEHQRELCITELCELV